MSDKLVSYSAPAFIDEVSRVLVVVPCGRSKIWDRDPDRGTVCAAEAYTGTPFRLNRQYAERVSHSWVVLSAKYGFVPPEFTIPEPYEVTFKHPKTRPISVDRLREQVRDQQLGGYSVIVGLGGKEYRAAVATAFADLPVRLVYPFAGLPLGKSLQATKQAISSGDPGFGLSDASNGKPGRSAAVRSLAAKYGVSHETIRTVLRQDGDRGSLAQLIAALTQALLSCSSAMTAVEAHR